MQTTPSDTKTKHISPDHHTDHGHLPSRKLRHANRKIPSYSTLVKVGLVLFGTLFVGFFAWELLRANREQPSVSVVEKPAAENPAATAESKAEQPKPQAVQTKPALPQPAQTTAENKNLQQTPTVPAEKAAVQAPQGKTAAGQADGSNGKKRTTGEAAKPKVIRYMIKKGDTLFKLSRQYYGNAKGVAAIARYNGLDPQAQLPAGKVIYIPLPNP
jgi:nucleoid-associated protein YgaU